MTQHSYISLSALQKLIGEGIAAAVPSKVWVCAEISEMSIRAQGHCYLELVEKADADSQPIAKLRATIWSSAATRILSEFESKTGQRLGAGVKIMAQVAVAYHPLYSISLNITQIDPSYTVGEVELQRRQTIARLQDEGVWDINREAEMPTLVQRVAVISSATAAGYRDFMQEIAKGGRTFAITLFEAVMQGTGADESIVAALNAIAGREEEFDAVAIIRGGGSTSDLSCFDSYRIASYVAQFPLPVLSGIGHDKDVSVVDMVAHTHLKTPTAVAAWLTARLDEQFGRVDYCAMMIGNAVLARLESERLRIGSVVERLELLSRGLVVRSRDNVAHSEQQLQHLSRIFVEQRRTEVESAYEFVVSHSLERVLGRGYAVVRLGQRVVRSCEDVATGDRLDVQLSDGGIVVEVK